MSSSTTTFLQCKVYLKPTDQVRRIQIDANCSLSDFINVAHQLYASNPLLQQRGSLYQPTMISVMYMDEENDWITVTTEPEWKDALQRQVVQLKSQSSTSLLLFKVQCTQIATHLPQQTQQQQQQSVLSHHIPAAVGETLCSTACSLIDQVKKGHHEHVQPLVEQARDKTREKVNKVQEWIHESQDFNSIKQSFKDMLDTVMEESSATANLLISEMYKDIESITSVATTNSQQQQQHQPQHVSVDEEEEEEPEEEQGEEEQQLEQSTLVSQTANLLVHENHFDHVEQEQEKPQEEVNVAPEDDFVFIDNENIPAEEEQQEEEEEDQPQPQQPVQEEEKEEEIVQEPTPVEPEPAVPVVEEQEEENEPEPEPEPEPILAVEQQPQPQEEIKEQELMAEEAKYVNEMRSLNDMGFSDYHTNLNLLIKHNGDLTQVVTALLA